jgi:hypothetical protein
MPAPPSFVDYLPSSAWEWGVVFVLNFPLTSYVLRFTEVNERYAPCALRYLSSEVQQTWTKDGCGMLVATEGWGDLNSEVLEKWKKWATSPRSDVGPKPPPKIQIVTTKSWALKTVWFNFRQSVKWGLPRKEGFSFLYLMGPNPVR